MKLPRVREWRERRGLTQGELAEISGVSARSIASYEAGGEARVTTARKLAEGLERSVEELAYYEGARATPKALARPSGSLAAQDPGVRTEAVIDMLLDEMRKQRDLHRQAINRVAESGSAQGGSKDPENEVNARLRELLEEDKDEALIDLAEEVLRLQDEILRLQDENAALQESARARV